MTTVTDTLGIAAAIMSCKRDTRGVVLSYRLVHTIPQLWCFMLLIRIRPNAFTKPQAHPDVAARVTRNTLAFFAMLSCSRRPKEWTSSSPPPPASLLHHQSTAAISSVRCVRSSRRRHLVLAAHPAYFAYLFASFSADSRLHSSTAVERHWRRSIWFTGRVVDRLAAGAMSNPVVRILAQIGLSVATVVGKAFGKAYQNAAAEAAAQKAGRVGAGAAGGQAGSVTSGWNRAKMMRPDEAYKVLNVDPKSPTPQSEIQQNFDKLFRINDVTVGGSFYLQSKVYRAKQTLDRIHKPSASSASASTTASSTASSTASASAQRSAAEEARGRRYEER